MQNERTEEIRRNIEVIRERIAAAAASSGRRSEDVRLMAVSKTRPVEDLLCAYEAGQRLFGENRVVEAAEKALQLPDDAEIHIIGHLQRNKARQAAEFAACIQSIDKLETAIELDKRAAACGRVIDVLAELNTSGEDSKSGYRRAEDMTADMHVISGLANLRLRGLMTMAPFTEDKDLIRASFSRLREVFSSIRGTFGETELDILSMGMSSDFEIAVEEGSTLVRVGTAIFGSRNY